MLEDLKESLQIELSIDSTRFCLNVQNCGHVNCFDYDKSEAQSLVNELQELVNQME